MYKELIRKKRTDTKHYFYKTLFLQIIIFTKHYLQNIIFTKIIYKTLFYKTLFYKTLFTKHFLQNILQNVFTQIFIPGENELGVVIARSEIGASMVPVSWTEMQCPDTYIKEYRKVAKVIPDHLATAP